MASLKARLAKLEQTAKPRGDLRDLPLGERLTVKLDFRPVMFRLRGFDLEELDPLPELPIPRRVDPHQVFVDFDKIRADAARHSELIEKLTPLDRKARDDLAKQHGFRVVYPSG